MMIRNLYNRIQALGQEQRGAVAILCLAGALILVMMGLLILDAADVANDKVHVQASADAAAHTQASVMARTMNMTAFANVGKRINVGYVAGYHAAYKWLKWLRNAGIILTGIICLGSFIPVVGGFLANLCPHIAMITAGATCGWEREHQDYKKLMGVVDATFGPEVRGFENYQRYMQDITPYWAWSKGVMSGFENQAPLTVGYPMPGPERMRGMPTAQLPIRPENESKNWDVMCGKANRVDALNPGSMDRWMMLGDLLLTNALSAVTSGPLNKMIKTKLDEAFPKEATGGGDLIEKGDDEDNAQDGTGQGGQGADKSEDEFDCDIMKNVTDNLKGAVKFDAGKKCDDDDDECEPRGSKVFVDGKEIKLDLNCLPIDDPELKKAILEAAGFLKKDCTDFLKGGQLLGGYYGAVFLSGFFALTLNFEEMGSFIRGLMNKVVPTFHKSCQILGNEGDSQFQGYQEEGQAWVLDTSNWLTDSSALIFAYRPSSIRNTQMRDNYFFGDGVNPMVLGKPSHGVWGMSRGEITWQGDNKEEGPSLWESKWGARVRPVALENEWNQGHTMQQVASSMEDVMLKVLQTVHFANPEMAGRGRYDALEAVYLMGNDLTEDIQTGFGAFQPDRMKGVNK